MITVPVSVLALAVFFVTFFAVVAAVWVPIVLGVSYAVWWRR